MKVSRKLFGYNLECTRRVGYSGIYAEMLRNCRFAAEKQDFYPVSWDSMEGWGQSTPQLYLLDGYSYNLTALGGEKTKIRLCTEYGSVLFEADGPYAVFHCTYSLSNARFEAVSDGELRYVSMKPANAYHNCRRDVLDALKALRPGTIRVPGGCFAERYIWKDGLLPIEDRPVIPDGGKRHLFSGHYGYDGYEFNIDDYAAISRYIDAEMEFTVRLRGNEPQDAVDLLEYCNGNADTKYGALRLSRGYSEPYNIRTWYIGNELRLLTDSTLNQAEKASAVSDSFVKAMREKDPDIRTVVSTGNEESFDRAFIKSAHEVDACSHHFYLSDEMRETDLAHMLTAPLQYTLPRLERARACIGKKPMVFDEWNARWGCLGSGATAMYAAGVMTLLMHHGTRLGIIGAAYFEPVNEGCIRVYPDHVDFSPDGEVLKRMVLHAEGEIKAAKDEFTVVTEHPDYHYISVYNPSVEMCKDIDAPEGFYEILIPSGDKMEIIKKEGKLTQLPPASVAFMKSKV